MATNTRPYVVTDKTSGTKRLVRATSQATARSHVARDRFAVEAASANDVLDLIATGVKAEDAAAEPQEAQQ
ncbi:hypothetical protein BN948_01802 [Hydrogenophaga intermedia]|uniref:Uncharacterized protein n=1 Tax=Hydrogenophaga intermedia TaxID=65786 RepID=A0A1L1PD01_HYDIT|nr:hypothetical protein [Hydrogenophaga intermedia]CDN87380.1 hypothetical protein BN948_01802 [Hydrogenophaga intermedia]